MSDAETFEHIISKEFLSAMESEEDATTIVYGVRILFYMTENPSRTMSKLIPWLNYDLDRAYLLRSELAHNMAGRALRGFLKYDASIWTPLAARVVQLAQIPF